MISAISIPGARHLTLIFTFQIDFSFFAIFYSLALSNPIYRYDMKNIFNETDCTEIRNRIQSLSAASPRNWGKMDLQQMLVHCTTQLKLAVGEIPSHTQGPSFMRSGLGKWMLFSTIPWPKGAKTPAEMNAAFANFYIDKIKGQEQLMPHPFFGKLNRNEWARLIYKHLDHHLKQFGSR